MIEWIIIAGLVIAMYYILYRYEKKMDKLHQIIEEHKNKIEQNSNRLDEHYNHIETMWVTLPKAKNSDDGKKEKA